MEKSRFKGKLAAKERSCDYSLHRVSRFIQPSILLFLSKSVSYGYELVEKLKDFGFYKELDAGAVYRTLRILEKDGFVKSFWEKGKTKKPKRYYKITRQGRTLLRLWTQRIEERKQALEKFLVLYNGKD